MKKTISKIFALGAVVLVSGCHTIVIENDAVSNQAGMSPDGKWHHTGVYGLVNYSSDLYDIKDFCGKNTWKTLTTQRSAGNVWTSIGLSSGVSVVLTVADASARARSGLGNVVSLVWEPLYVGWTCVPTKDRLDAAPTEAQITQPIASH